MKEICINNKTLFVVEVPFHSHSFSIIGNLAYVDKNVSLKYEILDVNHISLPDGNYKIIGLLRDLKDKDVFYLFPETKIEHKFVLETLLESYDLDPVLTNLLILEKL
ncbi:MAG TPA: hypothetical protein PKD00_03110 [Burkholderiales bacterium]|nr:hypothetical protein [Burkholderiales bacterium]